MIRVCLPYDVGHIWNLKSGFSVAEYINCAKHIVAVVFFSPLEATNYKI
jgi:hypothetical protein